MLHLLSINWDEKVTSSNANDSFNEFYNEIEVLLDKHLPYKKVSSKEYKRQFKPWITNGITKSCGRRDFLYRQMMRTKDVTRKKSIFKDFKIVRNEIINLIRISKTKYFQKLFQSAQQGSS